jgi:hypothetical protein
LYVPWSIEDAVDKLVGLLNGTKRQDVGFISDYQDKTIERTIDVFSGNMVRSNTSYHNVEFLQGKKI